MQVLSLEGVVLHLLMQLKENYFGACQDYVDMEADAPTTAVRLPEGDFDPRCFRPLDVRATLIMHDMQGHLMKVSAYRYHKASFTQENLIYFVRGVAWRLLVHAYCMSRAAKVPSFTLPVLYGLLTGMENISRTCFVSSEMFKP